jgi:hypothetical protein
MLRRWWCRIVLVIAVAAVLSLVGLVVMRSVVRVKSMVDHGSVATDYLKVAFRQDDPNAALVRAGEEYAKLGSDLEHWGWVVAGSAVVPPARDQFRAMEAIYRAGRSLVAARARAAGQGNIFRGNRGMETDLCAAAAQLENAGGRLYHQLAETRDALKALIWEATDGRCGVQSPE